VWTSPRTQNPSASVSRPDGRSQSSRRIQFQPSTNNMVYPHWVTYIRSLLEQEYGAQTLYHSGFKVYTTLDPQLKTWHSRS